MDVLAWGNKALDWLETHDPWIDRFRATMPLEAAIADQQPSPEPHDPMWDDVGDRHMGYYDRGGNRISLRQWTTLFHEKRVAEAEVTTAGGLKLWISTVWLGIDHRFLGDGPPVIFETMAFPPRQDGLMLEDGCDRYCTLEEAFRGHDEMVGQYAQDWWLDLGGRA